MIQKINVGQIQNQAMNKSKKEAPLADSVKVKGNFTNFSNEACNALKAQISFAGSANKATNGIEVGTVENEQSIKVFDFYCTDRELGLCLLIKFYHSKNNKVN